jgi:hypothetical protein
MAQVAPPFVVATAIGNPDSVPSATQSEVEPQEIRPRVSAPAGALWVVQFAPPSVVAAMTGGNGPNFPSTRNPTATQSKDDAHDTPSPSKGKAVGTPWIAQLVPPSIVAMMPAPTATQSEFVLHDTAPTPTPLGIV